jgi:hypothetical protein
MIGYHYRKALEAARILRDERKAERMFDDSGDTWVWRVCALLAVVAVLEWFAR